MSEIKRRHFLQFAGSALASIGLSQLDLMRQGNRYARVLAQGSPRKLALLVGINRYKLPIPSLRGCLTDVDLQRELLVNRFGFNPKDILLVTDEAEIKPTRQNILDAFENHLIKQAKPGDVVVFHFSGHGSRVIDPDPLPGSNGLNSTMVPPDRKSEDGSGKVRDIMGRSLFLLMYALQTENVTVVLDSCHSGGGTRGNVMFRALSRQGGGDDQATQEEFDYQEQWLSRLDLTPTKFHELRKQGIAKGVAIGSARQDQLATDAPFEGFHAGAFTYLLTRYLWQQPVSQSLKTVFVNLARSTQDVARSSGIQQDPIHEVQPERNYDQQPVYFIDPPTPSAEAVVQKAGSQVEFWLGGVASQTLESFQEGALFNLIDNQGNVLGEVEQTSRDGLKGYGKLKGNPSRAIQSGTFMREQVRGVPSNLKLRLGLDQSLGNEVNSARSVLQSIQRVEAEPVNQQGVADYLLGRMNSAYLEQARSYGITNPPPVGSVGLFTAGVEPIPDSFGKAEESVEAAIMRLRPRLKQLLAGRLLQQVVNGGSSNLKVENSIQPVGVGGVAINSGSRGAQETTPNSPTRSANVQQLAPGTEVQVEVTNQENRNIYMSVLVIGSNGDLVVLHPVDWEAPEDATLIAPGQTLRVPQEGVKFKVQGPSGFLELMVLASTKPLRDALKGLQTIARSRGLSSSSRSPILLGQNEDETVDVVGALLGDLDRITQETRSGTRTTTPGTRGVDTTQLAVISNMIEVVE